MRWAGVPLGLCLGLALAGVPVGEADEPAPFSSVDLRGSPGIQYANFTQVRGRVIFPNITYQNVTIFKVAETSIGGGYQVIQRPGFILAVTVTAAQNTQGTQRVAPGLALYWALDRLTVSASGGYSIFINNANAAPIAGIDPVEAAYALDPRWTVGTRATSFIVGQPVSLAILPFARYNTGHGFLEISLDNLGPGFTNEVQGRWALFF
jgi:hypothetical protein